MSVREIIRRLEDARRRVLLRDCDRARLRGLEERLAHLEALLEGLQDAVHRDSIRHEQRMAQLERKTEPEAIARALSHDARRRGL